MACGGGTADRDKVFDINKTGFVGADAVIAAVKGGDVFKTDVAAVAVDVVTVVEEVFDDDVAEGEIVAIIGDIDSGDSALKRFFKTGSSFGAFGQTEDEIMSVDFIPDLFAADDGPFARQKFFHFFISLASFGFVEASHAVRLAVAHHEITVRP